MIDKEWHKRLPEFEAFDEITLKVVPRFKTSGMSGDEWRQSTSIEFKFKGEIVHETGFSRMQHAIGFLYSEWVKAQEPIPQAVIQIEKSKCDQPSCKLVAVGRYRIKREFSDRGDALDPSDSGSFKHYRQFCQHHLHRGDSDREDNDKNYEPISGMPMKEGAVRAQDVSKSASVIIDLRDEGGKGGL